MYVFDMDGADDARRTLVASLAGVVARTSPEVHMAHRRSEPSGDPEFWLDRHVENNPATAVVWRNDPSWFVERYAPKLKGYVVYNDETINHATSVAGAADAVMVHESQLAGPLRRALSLAGLDELADVRGRSYDWVYDNFTFNRDVIFRQQSSKKYEVRSYAVLTNGFVFDAAGAARDRFLAGQNDHSVVLGWGHNNSEAEFFQSAAENNLTTVPADFLRSAAAPSRWEVELPPRPAKADPTTPTSRNSHYVAFVMSDGDNAQWLTGSFARDGRWFGSPHRGTFPMTFDLTPEISAINATALKYFYDEAAGDRSPTTFVTAGGRGINYPSQQTDPIGYAMATAAAMARIDHNVVSVLDVVYDTQVLNALASQPEIDGVMFKTHADAYAGNNGATYWHRGTPIASVRYTLWDGFETPNSLVDKLNKAPRDPLNDVASYSIVNVHPWSVGKAGGAQGDPMSNLAYIVANLSPGVEVVTLDELFVHLRNNREGLGGAD
ncbi:GxGYxYP domain-containing protein [Botrimarina sp.]|uniref:GxGYxYP domain-containing protein n=1 Tax=Botrimarina sp. TaxID=2795802 RepID=UPI0032ED6703